MADQLRKLRASDKANLLAWRNAPFVRQNVFHQSLITPEEHDKWLSSVLDSDDCCYFVFEADGVDCGVVGLSSIKPVHGRCEWGFYTAPTAPKGTATRMLSLALAQAFGPLGLRKVWAEVLGYNAASLRLHEKLGFVREGCLRQHHFINGTFHDVILLAKFSDDAGKTDLS
ncbi:MAG: UDP-4-amino-4,6-dideoxy-N-acetyl-beta-L-altrosamine N-acetyltransferase [Paracoccaceae bacterium]|jgi:UDP-4-amino-4,6-dideoxy-N-acetyl-beta-L-altrosamine N-acetyltransferase|nr:UDP-4-amino-4,6-dideoxy-N-acetyl-beta-L-altrosamine N-acetyltransferase [Paracoccaceae bacterium]